MKKNLLEDNIRKMQKNPLLFWDHCLGSEHWSMQDQIIKSVFRNQRTTVKSCHGIGKSYTAARLGISFLNLHADSIVITTAPTFRQVENIIWREWRSAVAKAKIDLGKPHKIKHEISEKWYALGVSADKDDNFQGYHAKDILVIVDEAAGVEPSILNAVEALLTSKNVRLLYIGNPTKASGNFYDAFSSPFFNKISVSVFDTPNFRANGIKNVNDLRKYTHEEMMDMPLIYEELVTPLWAWERLQEWGEENPAFQSRVCANFPVEGEDTLINLYMVEEALHKEWNKAELRAFYITRNCIGIDVARFGSDTTVFTAAKANERGDIEILSIEWHIGKDLMKTVGKAVALFNSMGFDIKTDGFCIDDTGLGGGVTDRLNELGYNVMPVNFAESSSKEGYDKIKAELFWNLRQLFKTGKIKMIDRGRIVGEIPTIKYEYTSRGDLSIISKKKMKKEGFDSPDFADSLALACYGFEFSFRNIMIKPVKKRTITGNVLSQTY